MDYTETKLTLSNFGQIFCNLDRRKYANMSFCNFKPTVLLFSFGLSQWSSISVLIDFTSTERDIPIEIIPSVSQSNPQQKLIILLQKFELIIQYMLTEISNLYSSIIYMEL